MNKMTLYEQIARDQLAARKAKKTIETALLTTLLGDIQTHNINSGKVVTDDDVLSFLKKYIKNINIVLEHAPGDCVAVAEREILAEYMPPQMSDALMRHEINVFALTSGKQLTAGEVMGYFKKYHFGKYDAKVLANLIKEVL
jgi:uncharacterized protein YqeY